MDMIYIVISMNFLRRRGKDIISEKFGLKNSTKKLKM